jgi:hypothetical protein
MSSACRLFVCLFGVEEKPYEVEIAFKEICKTKQKTKRKTQHTKHNTQNTKNQSERRTTVCLFVCLFVCLRGAVFVPNKSPKPKSLHGLQVRRGAACEGARARVRRESGAKSCCKYDETLRAREPVHV